MMDQGGYVAISERLGVELKPRRKRQRVTWDTAAEKAKREPKGGFLALGRYVLPWPAAPEEAAPWEHGCNLTLVSYARAR